MANEPEVKSYHGVDGMRIRRVWDRQTPVNQTQDRLAVIMRLQREFQEEILGHGDLSAMDPDKRAAYFRDQAASLTFELGELSNEIGWKPWATSRHLNVKAYASECIDIFHFLMNLMFLADMSADELYDGYLAKQRKNRDRQANGYDGVTGKCPGCHRSYDDAGVRCSPTHTGPDGTGMGWCEVYGTVDTPVVEA